VVSTDSLKISKLIYADFENLLDYNTLC